MNQMKRIIVAVTVAGSTVAAEILGSAEPRHFLDEEEYGPEEAEQEVLKPAASLHARARYEAVGFEQYHTHPEDTRPSESEMSAERSQFSGGSVQLYTLTLRRFLPHK